MTAWRADKERDSSTGTTQRRRTRPGRRPDSKEKPRLRIGGLEDEKLQQTIDAPDYLLVRCSLMRTLDIEHICGITTEAIYCSVLVYPE